MTEQCADWVARDTLALFRRLTVLAVEEGKDGITCDSGAVEATTTASSVPASPATTTTTLCVFQNFVTFAPHCDAGSSAQAAECIRAVF